MRRVATRTESPGQHGVQQSFYLEKAASKRNRSIRGSVTLQTVVRIARHSSRGTGDGEIDASVPRLR